MTRFASMLIFGVTVGGGLIPARIQLSPYANHELKIIPTPTQLSAYANHELKS